MQNQKTNYAVRGTSLNRRVLRTDAKVDNKHVFKSFTKARKTMIKMLTKDMEDGRTMIHHARHSIVSDVYEAEGQAEAVELNTLKAPQLQRIAERVGINAHQSKPNLIKAINAT